MRLHSSIIYRTQLAEIVSYVSNKMYEGNLILEQSRHIGTDRKGRDKMLFTLAVRNCRKAEARVSASGRHMAKASWQAHRDVMIALFDRDPDAFLHTALADYHGRDDFNYKYEATGDRNVGSMVNPVSFRETEVRP